MPICCDEIRTSGPSWPPAQARSVGVRTLLVTSRCYGTTFTLYASKHGIKSDVRSLRPIDNPSVRHWPGLYGL